MDLKIGWRFAQTLMITVVFVACSASSIKLNSVEDYINQGNTLLALNRPEDAIEHFIKALAIDPKHAEAHRNLGNAFLDLEKYEEAIDQFKQVIATDPKSLGVHNNWGIALSNLGLPWEAIAQYKEELAIDPNNSEAILNLNFQRRALKRSWDPSDQVGRGPSIQQVTQLDDFRKLLKVAVKPQIKNIDAEIDKVSDSIEVARNSKKIIIKPKSADVVKPVYPVKNKEDYEEASVYCVFIVAKNGKPKNVRCLSLVSIPADEAFIKNTEEAVIASKYFPGSIDGVDEDFVVEQQFNFKLDGF